MSESCSVMTLQLSFKNRKKKNGGKYMGTIAYVLFTYVMTAVIAYAVIGIIVLLDKTIGTEKKGE